MYLGTQYDYTANQTPQNVTESLCEEHPSETAYPVTVFQDENLAEEKDYTNSAIDVGAQLSNMRAKGQEEYLTRAFTIDQFPLDETKDGMLNQYFFPNELTHMAPLANKLRYYRYLRTGFKFKFLTNATVFHYGLLRACWLPTMDMTNTPTNLLPNRYMNHMMSLQAISNMPHVDIVLNEARSFEMTVPYELGTQFHDLASNKTGIGCLQIWVVNPLRAVNTPVVPVTLTVIASMDDPILDIATPEAYPFESRVIERGTIPSYIDTPIPKNISYNSDPNAFEASGHRPKHKRITQIMEGQGGESIKQEASEKSEKGIISANLARISRAARLLTPAPLIGSAAAFIGNASGIAGSFASLLGYGKPLDVSTDVGYRVRYPSYATSRGCLLSNKLTLDPENTKPDMSNYTGGTDSDMMLSKISSTSSFLGRIGYSESDVVIGTPLVIIELTPRLSRTYSVNFVDGTYRMTASTFSSSIAGLFKYYRGGMQVSFEFVFSKMHTQRFRVLFIPSDTLLPTGEIDQSNCTSCVFSVSGYAKKTFTIPYINEKYALDLMTGDKLGRLVLIPMSILATPYTTSSTVFINTYVCTTPEAEFFVLNPGLTTVYTWPKFAGTNNNELENLISFDDEPSAPEMEGEGLEHEVFTESENPMIFEMKGNQVGDNLTGENIRTVKDIIQRMTLFTGTMSDRLYINVVSNNISYPGGPYPNSPGNFAPMPLLYWFMLMFRFRDGGLNVVFPRQNAQSLATRVNMIADLLPDAFMIGSHAAVSTEEAIMDNVRAGGLFVPNTTETTLAFKVPYYNNNLYSYNNPTAIALMLKTKQTYVEIATSEPALDRPMISAADDFKLYKLFCPPTVFAKTS